MTNDQRMSCWHDREVCCGKIDRAAPFRPLAVRRSARDPFPCNFARNAIRHRPTRATIRASPTAPLAEATLGYRTCLVQEAITSPMIRSSTFFNVYRSVGRVPYMLASRP
jgi:hypothetical protein